MRMKRWISLLLIMMLTLTLLAGCKSAPQEEEGASAEDWVGVVGDEDDDSSETNKKPSGNKNENKDPDTNKKDPVNDSKDPEDDSNEPVDDSKDPEDDSNDPVDDSKDPDDPKDPVDDNEDPKDEDDTPKEWVPVQKETSGVAFTFMTQNVYHGGSSPDYTVSSTNQRALGNRVARFKSMIQANDPDVIFIQEVRPGQVNFYKEDSYLGQTYELHYQYRAPHMPDAGGEQAEPVMWKKARFECLDKGNFWLSDTPDRYSTSWNSSSTTGHNCNWAKLKDKKSGVVMYVYCVHIDPYGSECQYESMQLFYKKAALAKEGEYAFFGGDYNCHYRSTGSGGGQGYKVMMDDWSKICDFRDAAMYLNKDGLCELGGMGSSKNSGMNTSGGDSTELPIAKTTGGQIDYIMGKPMPNMCIDYYGFDYTVYDNKELGVPKGHISDHWGLVVKMRLDTDADYSQYYAEQFEYENDQYFFNINLKT